MIAKMDLNCSKLTILLKLDKNGNYTKIASEINLACTCLKNLGHILISSSSSPVSAGVQFQCHFKDKETKSEKIER